MDGKGAFHHRLGHGFARNFDGDTGRVCRRFGTGRNAVGHRDQTRAAMRETPVARKLAANAE